MILSIYIIGIVYCIYRMYKSNSIRHEDPTYATPALETLAIIVMAPVLMAVDVSFTWVRKYKEYREEKRDRVF